MEVSELSNVTQQNSFRTLSELDLKKIHGFMSKIDCIPRLWFIFFGGGGWNKKDKNDRENGNTLCSSSDSEAIGECIYELTRVLHVFSC